jgi:hypothetical protein
MLTRGVMDGGAQVPVLGFNVRGLRGDLQSAAGGVLRMRVPLLTPSLQTYNRGLGAWEPTVEPFGLTLDASVFSPVNDQVCGPAPRVK